MSRAADSTAEREFVHTRLIEAPRAAVFDAIAQPQRLARWWGPEGFSSSFESFDFRPGGHWRFVMHAPDGANYPNENVFLEIEAPARVVIDHPSPTHHFVLTIQLDDEGPHTRVHWRQLFDSATHAREIAAIVAEANEQNLSRLADELRQGPGGPA